MPSTPPVLWSVPAGGDPDAPEDDLPVRPADDLSTGDRIYHAVATGAASVGLLIVGLTFVFLLWESRLALRKVGPMAFLTKSAWNAGTNSFGVGGLIIGTFLIATVALCVAVPLAVAMALFVNEYAPRRLRTWLTSVVDLLAAVPSLIYGFWGFYALGPRLGPVARWMAEHLSALPVFRVSARDVSLSASSFSAGAVVGIMIMPIITSVARDVMSQVPRELCEGALALGGTRWGMIREVVLPFGRSGIIGATLLGFGRALGETIAVALMVAFSAQANWKVLQQGAGSIAALIVTRFGEASDVERSALIAAGLALFTITFLVNLLARRVVARTSKDWAMR